MHGSVGDEVNGWFINETAEGRRHAGKQAGETDRHLIH